MRSSIILIEFWNELKAEDHASIIFTATYLFSHYIIKKLISIVSSLTDICSDVRTTLWLQLKPISAYLITKTSPVIDTSLDYKWISQLGLNIKFRQRLHSILCTLKSTIFQLVKLNWFSTFICVSTVYRPIKVSIISLNYVNSKLFKIMIKKKKITS